MIAGHNPKLPNSAAKCELKNFWAALKKCAERLPVPLLKTERREPDIGQLPHRVRVF
jgi:hypothetical protein